MKATVGRIVHFHDESLRGQTVKTVPELSKDPINLNGQGSGPYPALVLQTFNGPYVNLEVHAYGGVWVEGSVSELTLVMGGNTTSGGWSARHGGKYWVWPPRES